MAAVPFADPSLFRAYDIRGLVGESLTEAVVEALGGAIGAAAADAGAGTLAVGRDGRLSSPALTAALIRGLNGAGRDVLDVGCVPTPVLYHAAHTLTAGAGVMVTGSHNPAAYNGLKVLLGGRTLAGAAIQALRGRLGAGAPEGRGGVRRHDAVPAYLDSILADVALERPLRVVLDCGNGAGAVTAPALLRRLGCRVSALYCEVDGRFPHHHPDPGEPDNLRDLAAAVRREGADLGLALDGDGDRLGVVDAAGEVVWPDQLLALFAGAVLARHPGRRVIYDVKCSRAVARAVTAAGGEPIMGRTGRSLMEAQMAASDAVLGGEFSGHLFFGDRWCGFDDGLYAGARLLELLAGGSVPARERLLALSRDPCTPELNVAVAEGEAPRVVSRLLAADAFADAERRITLDGLRVEYADGWGLVRASNTTPSVVLRFEADTHEALTRIQGRFRDALLGVAPGLALPF